MGQCVQVHKHSHCFQGKQLVCACGQVSKQRQNTVCVTLLPCLPGCLLTQQFKVNMWPRRVLCVFTELHLHVLIIPDASSHPA